MSDQPVAQAASYTTQVIRRSYMANSGIRTRDPRNQTEADLRLRQHGNRNHPERHYVENLLLLVHILSLLNPIPIDHSLLLGQS